MIGCENFGQTAPRILRQALDEKSGGLEKCVFLLPPRTKVLSMSFSPRFVPWAENFGCKVTWNGLLDFYASHWLKFLFSRPLASSVKKA